MVSFCFLCLAHPVSPSRIEPGLSRLWSPTDVLPMLLIGPGTLAERRSVHLYGGDSFLEPHVRVVCFDPRGQGLLCAALWAGHFLAERR